MTSLERIGGPLTLLGDDVNTDELHPSRFYSLNALTVKAGLQLAGASMAQPPVVIVAGRNFGYGSSRETTIQALYMAGIRLVLAYSLSRIFWRNAINGGIWAFELGETVKKLHAESELWLQLPDRDLVDAQGAVVHPAVELDAYYLTIVQAGGMRRWLEQTL